MFSKSKPLFLALAALCAAGSASAFSLLGPYTDWQEAGLGYNSRGVSIGGPQNRDEEYRWNVRTVYYGFDESFWNYFGPNGTNAVDGAVAILNALPNVSSMSSNLVEYPTSTRRVNYRAAALGIMDLKSFTLSALVEQLGLASPERYVWTLRNVQAIENVDYFTVVKRNFDPAINFDAWNNYYPLVNYSSFVNGRLYNFVALNPVYQAPRVQFADAVEVVNNPLDFTPYSVASGVDDDVIGDAALLPGHYYTGLTRDDVGGLRYLYHPKNVQFEQLPTNSIAGIPTDPWTPVGGTNTTTNSFVDLAVRGGVDHITFKKARYDSMVGAFIVFTNTFKDYYLTNNYVVKEQSIQRVIGAPDILFTAQDLGVDDDGVPNSFIRSDTTGWANNDPINGQSPLNGPGVIQPQVVLSYSKLGPYLYGPEGYYNGSETNRFANQNVSLGFAGFYWGSFDGRTNDPVLFPAYNPPPLGELEWVVLQGSGQGTQFQLPVPYIVNDTQANGTGTTGAGTTP